MRKAIAIAVQKDNGMVMLAGYNVAVMPTRSARGTVVNWLAEVSRPACRYSGRDRHRGETDGRRTESLSVLDVFQRTYEE
jgi:hypothetical protein